MVCRNRLQQYLMAAWPGGDTGSQIKDLGELSMLFPCVTEAKSMVGSLAHGPWFLLKPFLLCPVLSVFQWQKVLETACRASCLWMTAVSFSC